MGIGGFFMFRRFMKSIPKKHDNMSKLDWQNHWVEASRNLWTDETRALLDELVSPVPKTFRGVARHSIAAGIGQVAVERGATEITEADCIEGYIRATPARDYRSLITFLRKRGIDYKPYEHLLNK
jgi:hypothetical protein